MTTAARHHALVPAAGAGLRFGHALPKQYVPLLGEPLIVHTLRALLGHPAIASVHVVLSPDDEYFGLRVAPRLDDARLAVHAVGGRSRAETVRNGLLAMRAQAADGDWVLVHDAARPCLAHAVIDRLIATLGDGAVGGIAAIPVADTLKRADADHRIAHTVPRTDLWAAQTPQMFRYVALRDALSDGDVSALTDEAAALERVGEPVRLVLGDAANLKVTLPADLVLAERWLAANAMSGAAPVAAHAAATRERSTVASSAIAAADPGVVR
jgi:2-C-methyl-D-erythritol 4-phosphate cytidylyltransferase